MDSGLVAVSLTILFSQVSKGMFNGSLRAGKLPSPSNNEFKGEFSPNDTHKSFTFGVSRERMKKVYIYAVEK
jgi:hypothetical protein